MVRDVLVPQGHAQSLSMRSSPSVWVRLVAVCVVAELAVNSTQSPGQCTNLTFAGQNVSSAINAKLTAGWRGIADLRLRLHDHAGRLEMASTSSLATWMAHITRA